MDNEKEGERDEAYLKRHGWRVSSGSAIDPLHAGVDSCCAVLVVDALTIQAARDASEERDLTRMVIAARMSMPGKMNESGYVFGAYTAGEAMTEAENAVNIYREKYGRKP